MKYIELLNQFLNEGNDCTLNESQASQEDKITAISVVLEKIFEPVRSIVAGIDLSFIHKTRGDFFRLPESDNIDNIIMFLTSAIKKSDNRFKKIIEKDVSTVAHAIMCIQDLKYNFELAYRNKQTLLISLYSFIVLSIVYATSHLVSCVVDINPDSGVISIKETIDYESSNYMTALRFFNENTNSGNFKKQLKDIISLKEYINESDGIFGILTSVDVGRSIVSGFNKLVSFLKNNKAVSFKLMGIAIILLAIREIAFTVNNSKLSFRTILQNLLTFDGFITNKRLDKPSYDNYRKTANVIPIDIEDSSKMASREISVDDRRIKKNIEDTINDKYEVSLGEPASSDSMFI